MANLLSERRVAGLDRSFLQFCLPKGLAQTSPYPVRLLFCSISTLRSIVKRTHCCTSLLESDHAMANFKQPQKRRKSSGGTSRSVRGRTSSDAAITRSSAPRSTSGSSVQSQQSSSGASRPGTSHGHQPSTPLHRPASVASTRTFGGDEQSVGQSEQRVTEIDEDEDNLSEIVMGINMLGNGTVGCAYYVARTETLYFMEDVRMGGADIVDACKSC
jgi:hypothetical protein